MAADWIERIVDVNRERTERSSADAERGRGKWKRDVVAAYLFDGDFHEDVDVADFPGLVGLAGNVVAGLAALVFGKKMTSAREPEFRVDDFDVGPDEAALVVRDGCSLGVYHQERVVRGGFVDWLMHMVGVHERFRILLTHLGPFRVELPLRELMTADDEQVSGTAWLTFRVDPDRMSGLLRIMRGMNVLLTSDVAEYCGKDLTNRVIIPRVRETSALSLRSGSSFGDTFEAQCRAVFEDLSGDLGLSLHGVTIEWSRIDAEERALGERRADQELAARKSELHRSDELAGAEHELKTKRELRRSLEARLLETEGAVEQRRVEMDLRKVELEIQKFEKVHGLELRKLEVDQEFELSARNMDRKLEYDRRREMQDLDVLERKRDLDRVHETAMRDADVDRQIRLKQGDSQSKIDAILAQSDLAPEQILAMQAGESTAAAAALGEKFKAETARESSAHDQMLELAQRAGERLQEQATEFGGQMAGVAKAAAGAREETAVPRCPACDRKVERAWTACPFCAVEL